MPDIKGHPAPCNSITLNPSTPHRAQVKDNVTGRAFLAHSNIVSPSLKGRATRAYPIRRARDANVGRAFPFRRLPVSPRSAKSGRGFVPAGPGVEAARARYARRPRGPRFRPRYVIQVRAPCWARRGTTCAAASHSPQVLDPGLLPDQYLDFNGAEQGLDRTAKGSGAT